MKFLRRCAAADPSRRPAAARVAVTFALAALFVSVASLPCAARADGAAAEGATADGAAADGSAAIDRLIAKGSADSLATAAVLKQFGKDSDSGSYSLLARAVQVAPDRRDLAWLAVRLCASSSDCDDNIPEKHLHDVDPTNGIGSIGALTRAQRKNDAAAIDSALTVIGNSERFYVYFEPLVVATATELVAAQPQGFKQPASPRQVASATLEMAGVIAASVLPPSQSFSYSCKGMALEQVSGRLDRCRRAARAIARADAFIVEGLGLSLQQQLWPLDSPEGKAITAQRRVFQYRLEEYSRLNISSSKLDEFPRDALEVFRTHPREQDAALVYITKAGIPPDPPAHWISRSLPRVP
jgi:hypothetical protein